MWSKKTMQFSVFLFGLSLTLSATALHAAPTAQTILEYQGAGDTLCEDDERGMLTELKLLTAEEAKEVTDGQMETTPNSKYLLAIITLSPAAAKNLGDETSWSVQEVDANAKLDDFKPMLGTPRCIYLCD